MTHYGDSARTLVMLRIANGTVELETIESLCLLSYSSFLGKRCEEKKKKTYRFMFFFIYTLASIWAWLMTENRWQYTAWKIPPWSSSPAMPIFNA